MKMTLFLALALTSSFYARADASPRCTALSTVRGAIELKSQPYQFKGDSGTQFIVADQGKNPYNLMMTILDSSPNEISVVMTDLGSNQSSGFDGGFSSSGQITASLIVRGANSDDIIQVTCQK